MLAYPHFRLTSNDRDMLLAEYLPLAQTHDLPSPWPELPVACGDRDDRLFVALALAAAADFLVNDDADLAMLGGHLSVISPSVLRLHLHGPD